MSKPFSSPTPPQQPIQPIQHVQVNVPYVRQSQALPALVSFFLPGVGQLIQGRPIAWIVFSSAWVISLALCCVGIGFFIAPIVVLIATIEAAVYDPASPPSMMPLLAMVGAAGAVCVGGLVFLLGLIGLGAAAATTIPPPVKPPSASSPAEPLDQAAGSTEAAEPSEPPAPIVLDEPVESAASAPPAVESPSADSAPVDREVTNRPSAADSDLPLTPLGREALAPEREFRTWTSGKFSTEAQFVSLTAGVVKLKKRDGTIAEVPIDKLSEEDQRYIRSGAFKR